MPYRSDSQRKFFNANRTRLEAEGVDVDEWNQASKGKKLPKRVEKDAAEQSTASRSYSVVNGKPSDTETHARVQQSFNEARQRIRESFRPTASIGSAESAPAADSSSSVNPWLLGAAGVGVLGAGALARRQMLRRRSARDIGELVAKQAAYNNFDAIPTGTGPQQIANAVATFRQARSMVDPTETLDKYNISHNDFTRKMQQLGATDGDRIDTASLRRNPTREGLTAGALGALLGGGLGYAAGGAKGGLAGALAAGGVAGSTMAGMADEDNTKLLNAVRVLRAYGLKRPEHIREAFPLLASGYTTQTL
jgi:hypothetical protein